MIPLSTTTVTIKGRRPQVAIDPDASGYDPAPSEPDTLVTGLRATISLPSFKRTLTEAQIDVWVLRTDPFEIDRFDTVIDEITGKEYEIDTVGSSDVEMFGLAHTVAYIKEVKGVATDDRTSSRN